MSSRRITVFLLLATMGMLLIPGVSLAQDISISIERHARRVADGSITFKAHVSCDLPGTPDFREGLAGAGQPRTGAAAEGGLSPDVICDGVDRVYSAGISLITEEEFKRGPAIAHVTVTACNTVDGDQVCVHESARRRVIVSNRQAS